MQQQPPPVRWSRPSALLGLLWVCGLAAGRVPPAAAQSTLELQSYQQRLFQFQTDARALYRTVFG